MDDVTDLGKTIRAARKQRGWSQSALAGTAGVSRATVARIEAGRDISATSLSRLASALDLHLRLLPA
ncbi:MAG: helix-turn-helix transcriptional regulator [Euzebya sp.]